MCGFGHSSLEERARGLLDPSVPTPAFVCVILILHAVPISKVGPMESGAIDT